MHKYLYSDVLCYSSLSLIVPGTFMFNVDEDPFVSHWIYESYSVLWFFAAVSAVVCFVILKRILID